MFFKMLKNDLKRKKGLNIILFLFIAAASVLMFVSAAQLYMQITGKERTYAHCRTSDGLLVIENGAGERERVQAFVEELITGTDSVTSYSHSEGIILRAAQVDFDDVDEDEQESFFEKMQLVTVLPRTDNLLYDQDDKPFYVRNGTVAISHMMQNVTGAKPGDRMRLISPMGRVYEFEVALIYKEPSQASLFRYILSDADYAVFSGDAPIRADCYAVFTEDGSTTPLDRITSAMNRAPQLRTDQNKVRYQLKYDMNDDFILTYVLTIFIMLISIFMLIIILTTIRFTMIAALSEEEKEIGMMRAMGIESFGFRWLFAAKYIAFAVIGGLIGISAGYPLSRAVMGMFAGGITFPQPWEMLLVGTASALLMMLAIICFCMIVMRRIRRISVMDAIHGENRGERFGNSSALLLHRRRKMAVPVYLGISDILTRFKRYLFLVIAYTLGASMILFTGYLYDSVISMHFAQYALVYQADFFPDFSDDMMKEHEKRENAEGKTFWEVFNEELAENQIAAHVDLISYNYSEILTDGNMECCVFFDFDPAVVNYREGTAPELANEAAISSYTADQRGIRVGDEISVSLQEYSDDKLSVHAVEKKLIITGLIDVIEGGTPYLIMSRAYDRGYMQGKAYYGLCIDGDDKQAEYDKMVALFGGHVMTADEFLHRMMESYDLPLRLLRDVITGTVIFVTVLLTLLYMNIFIAEDTPEIALLRCVGFSGVSVCGAQLVRMLTLVGVSAAAAILLVKTGGALFVDQVFGVIGLRGFQFLPMPALTFGIMPLILLVSVLVPSLIRLRGIRSINIANISEE